MVELPFFKKLSMPSLALFSRTPSSIVGIDIGIASTKVVQLRYERERAVLETYGELLNTNYLKTHEGTGSGFLQFPDKEIAALLQDLNREAHVTAQNAVFSIPAASTLITTIKFPRVPRHEIERAIPFEARRYIPIPFSEVSIDWEIRDSDENENTVEVLLVAVPKEIIEKFKRVSELAGLHSQALEVETFSLIRSLIGTDPTPTAIINIGHHSTTLAIVDRGVLRASHNINRGSSELTRALELGLRLDTERAEAIKRDVGLSERIEEREITSVIQPLLETLFAEIERLISMYDRKAKRKVQKINLTGGGSNLKGIVGFIVAKFSVETTRGNPFGRIVAPAFMQPILADIGPSFAVSTGLALREITNK